MNIQDLPTELQNKIFYYAAEHPCAKMIKDIYKEKHIPDVDYALDEEGEETLIETINRVNVFKIQNNKVLIYGQESKFQEHWDILVDILKQRKRYREELGDHYVDF